MPNEPRDKIEHCLKSGNYEVMLQFMQGHRAVLKEDFIKLAERFAQTNYEMGLASIIKVENQRS